MRKLQELATFGCALMGTALALSVAIPAAAEPIPAPTEPSPAPPERVRVSYALGADCPPPDSFEAELDARLGPGWKASPDELARTLAIAESSERGVHVVRMDYQDGTGRTISRTTDAATCAEALRAMALITAVAIDAQVRDAEPNATRAPAPAPSAACPVCPAAPPCEPKPAAKPPRPPESPFVHEAGLRLGFATGFGSRSALGVGAEWGMVDPNGVSVRAAIEWHNTGNVPANDGRARFRALTARGEFCVISLALSSYVHVPLCGGVEAGVLWAEAVVAPPAVTFTQASYVPWVAALVVPRLRLTNEQAFVELMPELRVPLVGHTFLFASPERPAHEIPLFSWGAAVAAGARFR